MKTSYNESPDVAIGKDKWERADTARLVSDFETRDQTISQRDFAKMADVPRSTLRHWLARKNSIDAHPVGAFAFSDKTAGEKWTRSLS